MRVDVDGATLRVPWASSKNMPIILLMIFFPFLSLYPFFGRGLSQQPFPHNWGATVQDNFLQ